MAKLDDPPIRRSADPPIRRSADLPICRSADPPMRSGRGRRDFSAS
ncbi:hypothetical protein [Agromyces bauzanensis]